MEKKIKGIGLLAVGLGAGVIAKKVLDKQKIKQGFEFINEYNSRDYNIVVFKEDGKIIAILQDTTGYRTKYIYRGTKKDDKVAWFKSIDNNSKLRLSFVKDNIYICTIYGGRANKEVLDKVVLTANN